MGSHLAHKAQNLTVVCSWLWAHNATGMAVLQALWRQHMTGLYILVKKGAVGLTRLS